MRSHWIFVERNKEFRVSLLQHVGSHVDSWGGFQVGHGGFPICTEIFVVISVLLHQQPQLLQLQTLVD